MANKYTKTPYPDKKDLQALYDWGLTQRSLAIHYNVTQKIIWRWMRDLGIKARVPKNNKQRGDKNPNWKGINAGYSALHYRVCKAKGKPQKCEECGTTKKTRYQWANLTGDYNNLDDYKRMCQSCHAKFDKIIKNITNKNL